MGGQATRLGHLRKQDLVIGGKSLAQRAKRALAPHCHKIYTSSSSHHEIAGTEVLLDDGKGPAEAVAAAVCAIERENPHIDYLLVTPVDCWNLPAAVNQILLDSLRNSEAGVALGCWSTKAYPINCAIRLPANNITLSSQNRADKGRSMWSLYERSTVHQVQFEHTFSENPFSNINDFKDLLGAQALVQSNMVQQS